MTDCVRERNVRGVVFEMFRQPEALWWYRIHCGTIMKELNELLIAL